MDNIIVTQELIYSWTRRNMRLVVIYSKVDLENAYDQVDCGFLKEVLKVTSFKPTMVDLILECITWVSLVVSWNGETLEPFKPSRGLRQGDTMSPYLFVLIMEVLSQNITWAMEHRKWEAIKLAQGGYKYHTCSSLMIYSLKRLPFQKIG